MSVFVDAKQPHFVELGEFRNQHESKRHQIDEEMEMCVSRVSTGQHEQNHGSQRQKFSGGGEHFPLVDLFPVSEPAGVPLIERLEGGSLEVVKQEVVAHIMDDVCEGPRCCRVKDGDAQEQQM